MKALSIKEVLNAVQGELFNGGENQFILNVSTDSRNISEGDLFIPLKGDKFDGHNFIGSVFEKGAVCVLSEVDLDFEKSYIKVKDTKKALADLAEYYRGLFDVLVVAVTGSVGKTTTKDIIYSVLRQKFKTLKTEGNFNNEIGVPLTIFRIDETTEVLVLEMGMNHFNEIHRLSKMGRPDIAVITNIGYSHIENLGSRKGILKAKCEIFDFLKEGGLKILNGDDDMISTLREIESNTCFYGIEKSANDFYADKIVDRGLDGISCNIHKSDKYFSVDIKTPGKHTILNALCAAAVGDYLGIDFQDIKTGIENFEMSKMRMDIVKTDKFVVINDVYNANPASMRAGIDVLANSAKRKVCILGDMFELGHFAPKLHFELGEYVYSKNIDVIVCIGELSKNIYKGALSEADKKAGNKQNIYYFKTQEDFFDNIESILEFGDAILVKASRGMKFEKTVEKVMR